LPPKGAVARAINGPAADWDDRTELLAAAVDRLGQIGYLLHRAHFKGGTEPTPVPRPGDEPVSNGQVDGEGDGLPATLEEAAAFFRATREQ
jgi:hypothetical protein